MNDNSVWLTWLLLGIFIMRTLVYCASRYWLRENNLPQYPHVCALVAYIPVPGVRVACARSEFAVFRSSLQFTRFHHHRVVLIVQIREIACTIHTRRCPLPRVPDYLTDSVQACNSDPARTRLCTASSSDYVHCSTDKNETWRNSLLCGRPSYRLCNSLPAAVREADSLYSAKRKLKTHLFTLCLNHSVFTAQCTLVQSAVLRSHVVCLSVCLWRWWIVITYVKILLK